MTPIQWVAKLLLRHKLNKPDGRPLYQYRLTDNEFSELSETLKLSSMMGIQNIINVTFWDAAFVIYASEWWRRSYSGHWGWDGIFKSIRLDYSDLSTNKHHDLIETGLQRWKRSVRFNDGSRKYLGTIATEGGLPLKQLSDSGGWLNDILRPVIKLHISRGISISILIESHISDIPKSYRSPEIEQILADITDTIISLRKEHQLMDKTNPLEYLGTNQPNWRELFPLPVDDVAANSLLGDLVNTASKTQKKSDNKCPFEIDRFLLQAESPSPQLVARLELPTFVSFNSIKFDSLTNNFPSTFDVEIYNPDGRSWLWCRGIKTTHKGESKLKLSGSTFKLHGNDATQELRLRFKSMGEIIHELELLNGSYLDINLPWLFKEVDNKWVLHGIASLSVKNSTVLVYIPSLGSFKSNDENTLVNSLGSIFSGNIIKLEGEIQCDIDDLKFKLSCGKTESITQYHLTGIRLPFTSVPSEIFIGTPDLMETNIITGSCMRQANNKLLVKPLGVNDYWHPISGINMGCYDVKLLDDDGHVKLRKHIGILNSDFLLKLKPEKDVSKGSVQITGIDGCQINIIDDDIVTTIEQLNQVTNISLTAKNSPPISFNISLLPKGHKKDLFLSLPFPSKGALFFDPEGKHITFSTPLFLSELAGYRVKVFCGKYSKGSRVNVYFTLIDSNIDYKNIKNIHIYRKFMLNGEVTEFSIFDWFYVIKSLMSVSTSLDSTVVISMSMDGQDIFKLTISRFENEVTAHWDDGIVELDLSIINQLSLDSLEKIYISSLYLKQPEQSDDKLLSLRSEGVLTGKWAFSPETRQSGPWLIYPHIDSELQFRPLRWNVGTIPENDEEGEDILEEIDTLPKAIVIFDQELRNKAIHKVLRLMANDLEHKSWGYLKNLWIKCEHLPMSTFDIWKLSISETQFLACLLINGHEKVINKLIEEFPLIWELVKYSDWEESILLYKKKIFSHLDDEDEQDYEFTNKLIHNKINTIESLSESMMSHGEILKMVFLGKKSQDLLAMKGPTSIFIQPILDDEIQNLLRRQAESDWPVFLSSFIFQECNTLPNEYRCLLSAPNDFQQSVILLPMLLAWRSLSQDLYDEWPCNASEMFKIKQIINFDEDWFVVIYKLLSAWLSQQDLMESS